MEMWAKVFVVRVSSEGIGGCSVKKDEAVHKPKAIHKVRLFR